jgi:hypothetical protein
MFDIANYISTLRVTEDDPTLVDTKRLFELSQVILEDAYLCRAHAWGVATAMENQLTYLGGNLLPNFENKLNILAGRSVLSESPLDVFKFANEEKPHINDDKSKEDQILEQEARIDQVKSKMYAAAIMFVYAVRTHDEISETLGQLNYAAIKSRATSKRNASQAKQKEKVA